MIYLGGVTEFCSRGIQMKIESSTNLQDRICDCGSGTVVSFALRLGRMRTASLSGCLGCSEACCRRRRCRMVARHSSLSHHRGSFRQRCGGPPNPSIGQVPRDGKRRTQRHSGCPWRSAVYCAWPTPSRRPCSAAILAVGVTGIVGNLDTSIAGTLTAQVGPIVATRNGFISDLADRRR